MWVYWLYSQLLILWNKISVRKFYLFHISSYFWSTLKEWIGQIILNSFGYTAISGTNNVNLLKFFWNNCNRDFVTRYVQYRDPNVYYVLTRSIQLYNNNVAIHMVFSRVCRLPLNKIFKYWILIINRYINWQNVS